MIPDSSLKHKNCGRAVVSWTGGKDGCLALYKAILDGYKVSHLLNFRNTKKLGSHDISYDLLHAQSEAVGIPLICRDFVSYEDEFKKVVHSLVDSGTEINAAVFGHIETHGDLVERICRDLDIELYMPLWKQSSAGIINQILEAGFEVILASVKASLFSDEWLGRKIDVDFVKDLNDLDSSIDPCGESGEFHTLVTDGPIFKERIEIVGYDKVLRDGYWYLDVTETA